MPCAPAPRVSRRALLAGAGALLGGSALAGAPSAAAATGRPWRLGALGDSLTSTGCFTRSTHPRGGSRCVLSDLNHLAWALPLTRGLFRFGGLWATSGITSQDAVTQLLPAALAARPDACVVLLGSNDLGHLPLERTQANLRYVVARLRAAGIVPVLCTVPPLESALVTQQQVSALNTWIYDWARAHAVPVVDDNAALRAPDRRWRPGLTADGVHPTAAGAQAMGRALAGTLVGLRGPAPLPLLRGPAPRALLADPLHSRPGTWTRVGTGSYAHLHSTAWVGAKAVIATTQPSGTFSVVGRLVAQPPAGHRLRFGTLVESRSVAAGGRWSCLLVDRAHGTPIAGYLRMSRPLANAQGTTSMDWDLVMPALPAGSDVVVRFSVEGPPGTSMALAQTTLVDLGPA